jgi:isopenicillin-N N-acyltransferase like protein
MRSPALLCCLLLLPGAARADKPFRFPAAKNGNAELKYVNELPVLVVSGTPKEIGAAVGKLALAPGKRVLDYPRGLLKEFDAEKSWRVFLAGGRGLFKNFPKEYQEELEAMVAAARADRDLVIAGNTFFDLKKVVACSAALVEKGRSATKGTLLARNLDYPSLDYIHEYSLVTVYRPKGKYAFASVGFPGLVGVLSGMNEHGLAVGVLEIVQVKDGEPYFNPKGMPYMLTLRRVLEEAKTLAEARKVLEKLPRTSTICVAIADRNSVGVLEVTPKRVVLRSAAKGLCVCTNHFCSKELKPEKVVNVVRTFQRYDTLAKLGQVKEGLSVEALRKQLDLANLGDQTLQTMIFEPAALRLHLGIGKPPSSARPAKKLELEGLLRPGRR